MEDTKRKATDGCVFCGTFPLTGEHFWSDWARELLPHENLGYNEISYTENPLGFSTNYKMITKQGNAKSKKLPVVCLPCNTGWMSQIETLVRPILEPMIKGEEITIDRQQQRTLSLWVTLKVMVGEQSKPDAATFTPRQRHALKISHTIPPRIHIWVAQCGVGGWENAYWRDSCGLALTPTSPPGYDGGNNVQTTIFGIGNVLFYSMFSSIDGFDISDRIPVHGIPKLWPPSVSQIAWPLTSSLTPAGASHLSRGLARLSGEVNWSPLLHRERLS